MTGPSEPRHRTATIQLDGPETEIQALLAQIAQVGGVRLATLPLPNAAPGVRRETWESGDPLEARERLRGLRFLAGPGCAYVVPRPDGLAQVEFRVFDQDRCTLELVLRELPALLAILHDPGFQSTAGWKSLDSHV